ncbi:hypothetical protein FRC03_006927 [Tulasnella sp. 419]|nr:hypothetical protein FRC03_006927 [Tulasnella sp. 419]
MAAPGDRKCNACGLPQREGSSQPLLACGQCKSVFYHDAKCQKDDWKKHKKDCSRIAAERDAATFTDLTKNSDASDFIKSKSGSKPTVLVVTLEPEFLSDHSYYTPFISTLSAAANVVHVQTSEELMNKLASPVDAVLFMEPDITKRKFVEARARLVRYVKAGGTVVFGGGFSSFIRPNEMTTYFSNDWNLSWTPGSYHRTTFSLNPRSSPRFNNNKRLVPSYSMKALHVSGIKLEEAVYLPTEDSRIQSAVFAPAPIENLEESPAAFTQVGKGFVGYVGDVNAEDASTEVYLTMLGLRGT